MKIYMAFFQLCLIFYFVTLFSVLPQIIFRLVKGKFRIIDEFSSNLGNSKLSEKIIGLSPLFTPLFAVLWMLNHFKNDQNWLYGSFIFQSVIAILNSFLLLRIIQSKHQKARLY